MKLDGCAMPQVLDEGRVPAMPKPFSVILLALLQVSAQSDLLAW
jgi:hypothetical protein